jgi:dihydroorotate dehydrogenase (NAD+) catalytic subunit
MTAATAAERVDLTTSLAEASLDNPVMTASGCGGTGRELGPFVSLAELGAFVTPTVRRDASGGLPVPRVVESPAGLLSATGLPGPGIDGFLARDLPWLLQHEARPVVSMAGTSLGEYAELARRIGQTPGVAALEVALSWPGHDGTPPFSSDPVLAARAVSVVRRDAPRGLPVLVKLTIGAGDLLAMSSAVMDAGADGLVVGGSPAGLDLDPVTLRPRLSGITGGVSGPAVRPLALHAVWTVAAALPGVPVVACGGIESGQQALCFLAAGATAVQLGTAVLHDPTTPSRVVRELRHALADHGFATAAAAVGVAHQERDEDFHAPLR